jgi:hypothetical protein
MYLVYTWNTCMPTVAMNQVRTETTIMPTETPVWPPETVKIICPPRMPFTIAYPSIVNVFNT